MQIDRSWLPLLFVAAPALAAGCSATRPENVAGSHADITISSIVSGAIYNFGTLANPGSCMDAQNGATTDGTALQEWPCNGTGSQSYELVDDGTGAFYVVNTQANKCIDVAAAGTADGAKIQLYDCDGTAAQRFLVQDAGNGLVSFVNTNSNRCLDVTADDPSAGTALQLYDCNGTNAQLWNPAVIGGASIAYATQPGWTLTWSDEFDGPNGSGVNPNNWGFDTGGGGWGNGELEYYTSGTSNAVVSNGALVITATTEGAWNYGCWYGACQYTSARLNTAGKFAQQYGRFEARIQIPTGQGSWPGFWMLGADIGSANWPACGEIDVMENVGSTPDTIYGTTHGPGPGNYPEAGLSGAFTANTPFGGGFHVFAAEWGPGYVTFFVDGAPYWTVTPATLPAGATWVWDQPFFLLLDVAIGGGWPGSPNAATPFPQEMLVDYVRVYGAW